MAMKGIGLVVILAVLLSLNSCANYSKKIQGTWYMPFENEMGNMLSEARGLENVDSTLYRSTVSFEMGRFEIYISPPISDSYEMKDNSEYYWGYYEIENDELVLNSPYDGKSISEKYRFYIKGESLLISLIGIFPEEGETIYAAQSKYVGGLFWGWSCGIKNGRFYRVK